MTAYFVRRLLLTIPTFLGITLIVFLITRVVPGGPLERQIMQWRAAGAGQQGGARGVDAMQNIPPTALEELKKQFDLDQPAPVAYLRWLSRVARLDLGRSYYFREPVWDMIASRFPISITFGLTGYFLAYLISVPLGILKALRHGTSFDFISSALVFVGYSIPGWCLGMLLVLFLASGRFVDMLPLGGVHSIDYEDLPVVVQWLDQEEDVVDEFGVLDWRRMSWLGRSLDFAWHMLLPVVCYTASGFATLTILTKNSLLDNLSQDYVRTAFAKGLSERRVIFLHTLRNSLIPLATGIGQALALLLAGSYLIELIFNIDGVGYLGYNAVVQRDYIVVMGILVLNTVITLLGNIISDLLYALIDPRIRFE